MGSGPPFGRPGGARALPPLSVFGWADPDPEKMGSERASTFDILVYIFPFRALSYPTLLGSGPGPGPTQTRVEWGPGTPSAGRAARARHHPFRIWKLLELFGY